MKKIYVSPEMESLIIEKEDVITNSLIVNEDYDYSGTDYNTGDRLV